MITKEEAWDNYTVARDMAIDTKEWKPGWREDMYREMDARVRAYGDACQDKLEAALRAAIPFIEHKQHRAGSDSEWTCIESCPACRAVAALQEIS